jgi:hypothetical protein
MIITSATAGLYNDYNDNNNNNLGLQQVSFRFVSTACADAAFTAWLSMRAALRL